MRRTTTTRPVEVILVDDHLQEAELAHQALMAGTIPKRVRIFSEMAQMFAEMQPSSPAARPDLILLNLNPPHRTNVDLLTRCKQEERWRSIPLIVLSRGSTQEEILDYYSRGANCYLSKPVNMSGFMQLTEALEAFWFQVVLLPNGGA